MSIRSRTEEEFKNYIIKYLKSKDGFLASHLLDQDLNPLFDIKNKNNIRILYPIHSYEIFEMNDGDVLSLQKTLSKKIEQAFEEKVWELSSQERVSFLEKDILINLEYRIAVMTLEYDIVSLKTP